MIEIIALLISFRLTKELTKYDKFFDEIFKDKHLQLFDGCIISLAGYTPFAMRKALLPFIFPNDHLFVCTFHAHQCAGQLSDKQKQWIKLNIMDKALPKDFIKKQLR